MPFPIHRPRRLRTSESIRRLVRETRLDPARFILPLFVCPGEGVKREISSMPGNYQLSVDELVKEANEAKSLGVGGVILFTRNYHNNAQLRALTAELASLRYHLSHQEA